MDRNIISKEDSARAELAARTRGAEPFAGPVLKPDDYWARLLKQVPVEVFSAYLIIDGLLRSGLSDSPSARSWALGVAGLAGVLASFFFSKTVLGITRMTQIISTSLAFAVSVFAVGGWFSTTSWYEPWMGSIAVVVFGLWVRIARVAPLPGQSARSASGHD